MAISHCYWHPVVKNDNFTLLLTFGGQEWQLYIATDIWWSRMVISHCYWHLIVKNGNFTLLIKSSAHIAIDIWSGIATDILVKNGNFTLLLTSIGNHIATDIWWLGMAISHFKTLLLSSISVSSRMAISHCYWHLVVKNGNFTLLLTSSGQEWQFHIATDI